MQIAENPYLQYFLGFSEYKDEVPFDPSLMTHFKKRFEKETLAEINESIVRGKAKSNVEFGAKVSLSLIDGFSFVDRISWDNYNESGDLIGQIKITMHALVSIPNRFMPTKSIAPEIIGVIVRNRGFGFQDHRWADLGKSRPKIVNR